MRAKETRKQNTLLRMLYDGCKPHVQSIEGFVKLSERCYKRVNIDAVG